MKKIIVGLFILALFATCNKPSSPETNQFDIIFKYGISGEWIDSLNTSENNITRIFCFASGGGDTTITFSLTNRELDSIRNKMQEINLFNHSDSFQDYSPPNICNTLPASNYYLKAILNNNIKELSFNSNDFCKKWDGDSASSLAELVNLIKIIYQSKPTYITLPNRGCVYN